MLRYVYPYYHRRYVFVSLGGYWPSHYRYTRYYWYPSHFYDWCGYSPVAREVQSDTYNYYTYNYYYDDTGATTDSTQPAQLLSTVDENTFADVRAKLAAQAEAPDVQTLADTYFEEAVKAFEAANYSAAADKFVEAIVLAPDDMVLPFAYVQALFADKKYLLAAQALREALAKVPAEEEGVFYPRGLYPEEDVLFAQIDHLAERASLCGLDPDLQLLLGYQLLGTGEHEAAAEPLQQAKLDSTNTASATILLELLEKIKTEADENTKIAPIQDRTMQKKELTQLIYTPSSPPAAKSPSVLLPYSVLTTVTLLSFARSLSPRKRGAGIQNEKLFLRRNGGAK